MRRAPGALASLIAFTLLIAPVGEGVAAAEAVLIDTFDDWSAFQQKEGNSMVCYMGSVPKKQEGSYEKRGDAFVLVAHRPADKSLDVVSVEAGYPYREGNEATMLIGGQSFQLFTKGSGAWARDAATDGALVAAMKRGIEMVVKGTSNRGTLTTDTYSLSGFTAAHAAISKACNVR